MYFMELWGTSKVVTHAVLGTSLGSRVCRAEETPEGHSES